MNTKNNRFLKYVKDNNIIFILIVVFAAACILAMPSFTGNKSNTFIKLTNLFNLSQSIGTYGILAIGLTFVFIVGGIDLSIGYQVAFTGTIMAILTDIIGLWPAVIASLVIGTAIGYLNGTIVTRLKIPPLIGTLAVMTFLKGIVLILNKNSGGVSVTATIGGEKLSSFYNLKILGFLSPPLIIAIIMLVALGLFLKMTRSGMNMYIVGDNPEAGLLSGIHNDRLSRMAYSIGGFCAALCANLSVFRVNASTYNMGDNIDIIAICAVVVGGIKMSGGKGNMGMCIMGVAVIQTINNLMSKLGLHSAVQALVTGIVVILVLIADRYTGKRADA